MINWHLETIAIKDLKEHAKNPRQITKEQQQHLTDLMEKFGLIEKPIVNRDGSIIGGHQRIRILKKQKVKSVECWMPDVLLDSADVDRLCIGLNQGGEWNWDCLANEWEPLDLLSYGFTEKQLLGFTTDDDQSETDAPKKKKTKMCPSCGHEF